LDWLVDHKGDLTIAVQEMRWNKIEIDWLQLWLILINFLHIAMNKCAIIRMSDVRSTYDTPQTLMGGPDRVTVSADLVVQCTRRWLERQQENCDAYDASFSSRPCVFLVKQISFANSARRSVIGKAFLITACEEALSPVSERRNCVRRFPRYGNGHRL